MSYKSMLMKPLDTVIETEILGQQVFIRRLSSQEMLDYQEAIDEERSTVGGQKVLALRGINLLLSALVNPDGTKPASKDLPAAEDLLTVHSTVDIVDAVTKIQRHSYGTLEEAKKN